ncbi:uncharacterized protein LOC144119926 [Amblyomma americanum]
MNGAKNALAMAEVDRPTDGHRRESPEPVEHSLPTWKEESRNRRTGSPSHEGLHEKSRPDSPAMRTDSSAIRPEQASDDRTQQHRSSATLEVQKRSPLSSSSSLQPRPRHSLSLQSRKTDESTLRHGVRKWWRRGGSKDRGSRGFRHDRLRGDGEEKSRGVSYIMRIYEREPAVKLCRLLYAGLFALFLLMFAYFVVRTLTSGKDVRVRTPMGLVDGTHQWVLERNVFYYLGLPYASKPARFQRAMPLVDQFQPNYIVPKRPNVRCLQVRPNGTNSAWPQSPADRGGYAQPIEYSEDCLYLNVWSPVEPCDYRSSSCGPAVPVLVVLFSVGFVRGGADWYDGAVLASLSGMVVVAPNFRLGPLAVPIKEKHTHRPPLLSSSDQLLAMHWTWDNIRHFGGNGSQVNVLGAGGGAWTVGEFLLSNREGFRDHIQRVALHGGSPLHRYHPIPARLVEQDLGCGPASSECLEAADASLLENLASRRLQGPPDTLTVTEARPGNQHVLLLGYVAGQGTALLGDLLHDIANGTGTEPPAELWLQALQDQLNFDDLKAVFEKARKKTPPDRGIWVRFLENLLVRCPAELLSDLVRDISFLSYGFVYVTDPDAMVADTSANSFPDLDLIFGVPLTTPNHMYPERLKQASLLFMKAWATFMKTGRLPTVNGEPWPVLIEDTPRTALEVVIRDGFKLSAPTRFVDTTCDLINDILKKSVRDEDSEPISTYTKRTRFLVQRNQSTSGSWFSTNDTSELPEDATSDSSLDGPLPVAFQRTLKAYPVVPTTSVRIVLIVAYYRSGSSFFGELLSSGPKTYFHFEPLQPFTRAGGIRPGRQRLAFALLDELVRCRMYNAPLFTLWQENRSEYKHNRFLADVCKWGPSCSSPDHISALCSRAETQVFKFTRLSIAQVVAWINRNSEIAQQVQMVHLVRDPRGIYASRRNTSWCINAKECGSAKALCAQMRQDLDAFENLSGERWLNRKHRVRFEDVAADPVNETEALFSRLALEYGPSVTSFVKTHTVANEQHMNDRYSTKRNTKEIIRSWTKKLSKQDIGLVERVLRRLLASSCVVIEDRAPAKEPRSPGVLKLWKAMLRVQVIYLWAGKICLLPCVPNVQCCLMKVGQPQLFRLGTDADDSLRNLD